MDNEHKTIHEFDFSLICEYFSGLERQGPGSPEVTIQALSLAFKTKSKECHCWWTRFRYAGGRSHFSGFLLHCAKLQCKRTI